MDVKEELFTRFQAHQQRFAHHSYLPIASRVKNLRALKKLLQVRAIDLAQAINSDYRQRAFEETLLLEIFPTISAINYCIKHLKKWTRLRKRKIDWYFGTGKAFILAQPLGVVGIISPWNYPVYLSFVPLAYALAAGNHVMLKMSESTPLTGNLIQELVSQDSILNEFVSIYNGDASLAAAFTSLPFGHLLFTGSTKVGKKVMAAASENLTPVTLELGGKSPTIISATADAHYLDRVFMGKLFNAGQTCLAPDYLLIARPWEDTLEQLFTRFIENRYPQLTENNHYSNVISTTHKARLNELLADARNKGARIKQFGNEQEGSRMPFYLVFNVDRSMQLMNEEIFGPILPIIVYDSFSQALDLIKSRPNPLAVYYFGKDEDEIKQLQFKTLSGALTINDTIMHAAMDDLPFGGVGQSGLGNYHGQEGFDTFSKLKPVLKQGKLSAITFFYPPYGKLLYYFLRYWAGIHIPKNKQT
ncbi:alcohol dehydrogenase [Legionella beliardensis]|uniref:Aldehyde dehydrogenase n=1 Tax=Legionella beliardensis TaxID=91822 RepID=A0A378I1B6_9GAMM|nr:coniferyl aldehyde dehydrogenase [Legionella beliardensis]STX28978.1 alcohol dehydrogenase [Legionella beliardensis]